MHKTEYPSPLISIVLPTHNGERYIRESIDSCFAQTCGDFELIVVDDGSTDATTHIVCDYRDDRIRLLSLPRNVGIARALNAGFAESSGRFLTWTSDDNRYHADALSVMAECLLHRSEVDFVYTAANIMNDAGHVVGRADTGPPEQLKDLNCVGACFLYRRRVYDALGGFDPGWQLVEDYEYWLRANNRFTLKYIDKVLYDYRVHDGALGRKSRKDVQLRILLLKHKYVWNNRPPGERRNLLCAGLIDLSWGCSKEGDVFRAFELGKKAIQAHPLYWKAYKRTLSAVLPVGLKRQ